MTGQLMIAGLILPPLADWGNFYVIVGSSAGALTGLQFVVIALVAQAQSAGSMLEIRAFATPNIVHFCAALLISAILSAPWHALASASEALGIAGAAGVVYALMVIRHARRQTHYQPDIEDWVWYTVLPLLAYATLLGSGLLLSQHPAVCMFVIAAAALLLLFIGIHNAWDTVTYVTIKSAHHVKQTRN